MNKISITINNNSIRLYLVFFFKGGGGFKDEGKNEQKDVAENTKKEKKQRKIQTRIKYM